MDQPRVAEHVLASGPRTAFPEADHAALDVEDEDLALLLSVVSDSDAGLDLPGDDPVRRVAPRRDQRVGVYGTAPGVVHLFVQASFWIG